MTTEQRWKPIKPAPPVSFDESPQELRRRHVQAERNWNYLHEIWDELLRDHRGKWLVIWGDQHLLIGDEPADVLNDLPGVERSHCLFRVIAPEEDFH